jgi:hypothetical protein
MMILIEVEGVITNSQHIGHTIKVVDDRESSGGFLIFEWWPGSNGPNQNNAFDSWVENEVALEEFFLESGWVIEWHS